VAIGEGQFALRNAHIYLEHLRASAVSDASPDDSSDDDAIEDLITQWFALDREHPWLGQTIEPKNR
jgi:hypothetical protein